MWYKMISKNPIFNNVLFKIGFLETISNLLTIKTYLSTIINSIKIYTIGSKSNNKSYRRKLKPSKYPPDLYSTV